MVHMAAWPPGNEDGHDVLDGDEEQDLVLSALARADGDKGATLDAGANKRVTREAEPAPNTRPTETSVTAGGSAPSGIWPLPVLRQAIRPLVVRGRDR